MWTVDADGDNLMQLTDFRRWARHPVWFDPSLPVSSVAKRALAWGWLKRMGRRQ